VQQGATVADITQQQPLRVLFSVPQTEAGGLAVGAAFSLSAPSAATATGSVTGRITALSPMVNATTNARDAEGVISGDPDGLLPGMFGTVTLATGAPLPAFAVPATALNDSVLGPFIYVLDPAANQTYTLRTVYVTKLGDAGANTFIAADGLHGGQLVLVIGGFKLTAGASVTLADP
jgi:multidrug efflux pump subunit AcrA (membrane-fusion protein)